MAISRSNSKKLRFCLPSPLPDMGGPDPRLLKRKIGPLGQEVGPLPAPRSTGWKPAAAQAVRNGSEWVKKLVVTVEMKAEKTLWDSSVAVWTEPVQLIKRGFLSPRLLIWERGTKPNIFTVHGVPSLFSPLFLKKLVQLA